MVLIKRIRSRASEDTGERYVYDASEFQAGSGGALVDPTRAFGWVDDIVLVFDESGTLVERLLHGPQVDQVLASEDVLGDVQWFLGDHLGTIRDVVEYDSGTDTTTVVNHLQYSSFGQITSQTSSANEPRYAFTGREWDADADLYYYRARWYDPTAGRFISEDPIGFAAGDVNVSRYVGNAAVFLLDSTGLSGCPVTSRDASPRRIPKTGPSVVSRPPVPAPPFTWPYGVQTHDLRTKMQAAHGKPEMTVLPMFPAGAAGCGSGALCVNPSDDDLTGVGGALPCVLVIVVNPDSILAYHFGTSHNSYATLCRDADLMSAGAHVVIGGGDNSPSSNFTLLGIQRFLNRRDDLQLDGIADTSAIYASGSGEYFTYETAVELWTE